MAEMVSWVCLNVTSRTSKYHMLAGALRGAEKVKQNGPNPALQQRLRPMVQGNGGAHTHMTYT